MQRWWSTCASRGSGQAEAGRAHRVTSEGADAGAAGFVETLTLKVSGAQVVHYSIFVRRDILGYNRAFAYDLALPALLASKSQN